MLLLFVGVTQPAIIMLLTPISVNSFMTNIDKFWCSQDVYYNYKCDIAGTGNRSVSNKSLTPMQYDTVR